MMHLKLFCLFVFLAGWSSPVAAASSAAVNQNAIPVNYRLMDQSTFQKLVVGNTIGGITSQSQSLYLVHFAKDGSCDLWKKNRIYPGTWWIEKDEQGRDFVRALWPDYVSNEQKSLFSPNNPNYGAATSVWYYVDPSQPDTLLVATKNSRSPVILVPGRAFP